MFKPIWETLKANGTLLKECQLEEIEFADLANTKEIKANDSDPNKLNRYLHHFVRWNPILLLVNTVDFTESKKPTKNPDYKVRLQVVNGIIEMDEKINHLTARYNGQTTNINKAQELVEYIQKTVSENPGLLSTQVTAQQTPAPTPKEISKPASKITSIDSAKSDVCRNAYNLQSPYSFSR